MLYLSIVYLPKMHLKLGPVVEEVYRHYKKYGRNNLKLENDDFDIDKHNNMMPIITAKLLSADDVADILASLKHVLHTYGNKSASELVSITHGTDTPWSKTELLSPIKDDVILKYRPNEYIN